MGTRLGDLFFGIRGLRVKTAYPYNPWTIFGAGFGDPR